MQGSIEDRAVILGEYIWNKKATVRTAAKVFGISKSTVHKDVSVRLKTLNPSLYRDVKAVLMKNKEERHLRGGLATREKYLKLSAKEK
ncbi:MAG: sporulation transcriptional regulator SpoIIID [Eubacteriales bacterium]|nr:sporulation transcriptional regulator SpoIIID [Eubacteriales bacterium]